MGKPKAVSAYGATFRKLGNRSEIKTPKGYMSAGATDHDICDCEDLATALIRFEGGATMFIDASFSLNNSKPDNNVQLFGTKGGVKLADKVELYTDVAGYLADVSLAGETGFSMDAFVDELRNFTDAILGKAECRNPAEDGVEIMKILDAIYRSAECGHEVLI